MSLPPPPSSLLLSLLTEQLFSFDQISSYNESLGLAVSLLCDPPFFCIPLPGCMLSVSSTPSFFFTFLFFLLCLFPLQAYAYTLCEEDCLSPGKMFSFKSLSYYLDQWSLI